MPKIRELCLPAGFFCFLYWGITQFIRPATEYRSVMTIAIMTVGAALLALHWVRGNEIKPLTRGVVYCGAAFFFLGVISAENAVASDNSFSQLRLYFSVCLLALGFYSWFGSPSKLMVTGFLFALCLTHVLILIVVLGHASGIMPDDAERSANIPYHGNIRHVSHHGMVAACGGLALFLIGGRLRLTGYFLGAAANFGLVFLGQRGGLLGLAVFTIVAAILLPDRRKFIAISGVLTIAVSLAAVYVLDRKGITNQYSGSIVERVQTNVPRTLAGGSGRGAVWKSSIELALQRPMLGHGADGFRTSMIGRTFSHIAQSHNLFLQMFVELGFPGLILVSLFLYQLLRASLVFIQVAISVDDIDPAPIVLFAMFIGFLAQSMVEGLFYHPIPLLIISMLGPLMFAAIKELDGSSKSLG